MQFDDILWLSCFCGDLIDIQIRCVGGEYCVCFVDFIELMEDIFFDVYFFKDGFDYEINFCEISQICGGF